MQIEDNLTLLTSIIKRGELIIIRTDGIWGLACDAKNKEAIARITSSIVPDSRTVEEIIVADLKMFKACVSDLHPRVETLLSYHQRPLRIKCVQKHVVDRSPYIRIVKDTVSRILLTEVRSPLYFVSFLEEDERTHAQLPQMRLKDFGKIAFIANEERMEVDETMEPIIKVEFDSDGLIQIMK